MKVVHDSQCSSFPSASLLHPRSKRKLVTETCSRKLVKLGFLRPDSKLALKFPHLVGVSTDEVCEDSS